MKKLTIYLALILVVLSVTSFNALADYPIYSMFDYGVILPYSPFGYALAMSSISQDQNSMNAAYGPAAYSYLRSLSSPPSYSSYLNSVTSLNSGYSFLNSLNSYFGAYLGF